MRGDRNKEIRQNQPFCTFLTSALPDRPTEKQTDKSNMTSYLSRITHKAYEAEAIGPAVRGAPR